MWALKTGNENKNENLYNISFVVYGININIRFTELN